MNDASGEHVERHILALESQPQKLPQATDNDQAHLDPSRWFFASSLFPMAAGTLGPVASAFSICALVRPWRQYFPPGSDIQKAGYIDDPPWLIVVNAIQLAIAVIANLSLLLNMTKRIRFTIAQPVTIIGWYISAVCLVALIATAAGPLRIEPRSELVWSQAFYYGIYAAVLYFIVASLMVVTFWGAYTGHYDKDFQLTPSQRTLMLQTILFLTYLLIGALVFSNIEGWNYLDALYWADVTLFTVGFGDFSASTTLGRVLLIPYALVGIISLGLVIGSIRSLVLERGKRRLDARMIEKKRRKLLREMAERGDDTILEPIREKPQEGGDRTPIRAITGLSEFQRRQEEFKLMRQIQQEAARRRRWVAMGISSGTWMALWLVGAKVFQKCEAPYQKWTYFDAFYFCFVSLTTIGYGDVTPISNSGKSFFVFWSLLALPTMTVLISNAGDTIVKGIRDATDQLGTITILPGELGFKNDLKRILRMLSCGRLFDEDIEESPPGFLGDAEPIHIDDSDDDNTMAPGTPSRQRDQGELNAERGVAAKAKEKSLEKGGVKKSPQESGLRQKTQDTCTTSLPDRQENLTPEKRSPTMQSLQHSSTEPNIDSSRQLPLKRTVSIARQDLPSEIPRDKAEYHIVLIEEIARVTRHLKHKPPRKYSFAKWAWYLKLIGEDEGCAETHRKARPHVHARDSNHNLHQSHDTSKASVRSKGSSKMIEGETKYGDVDTKDGKQKWSWVGSRSPLMGSQEEAEWILERLTQKLSDELREARNAGRGL